MKKKIEEKPKVIPKDKYQVIKSTADSSFGYWIIPLVVVILIGLTYIATTLLTRSSFELLPSTTQDKAKDYSIDKFDFNENRSRASEPINLDETTWGRTDPLAPPE